MPTYDYRCDACGKRFSVRESIASHATRPPRCPACASRSTARVLSAFYAKTVRKS